MATDPPPGTAGPGEAGVFDDRATSEVIASLITNTQGLVRTEVELAKHELTAIVRAKAIAIGLVLVAALLGLFLLAFVGVTAAHALMLAFEPWLAWLLVTVGYLLLAGILVGVAIPLLKRSVVPERTKAEIAEIKRFATEQVTS